jgi:transposase-like protein
MKTKMKPFTVKDFTAKYPNDDACLEWLKTNRWPEGITCPTCQKVTKHHKVTGRPVYACDYCGHQVSPMAGTILEHSSTPLRTWFHAMFLMANTRCGISAKQVQRETGVTYKTAWRMFKQIRSMLTDDVVLEGSSVEADETYIGGKRHGKRGRGAEGKTPVFGLVERKGKVIAKVVPNVQSKTLLPIIKEKVLQDSTVYTDELPSYDRLSGMGYEHKRVHHATKVYVMGDAHTNTIEGFWSLVKRGISGVNHAVSTKYLPNYLNEYSFRYNRRQDEQPMFESFLSQVVAVSE